MKWTCRLGMFAGLLCLLSAPMHAEASIGARLGDQSKSAPKDVVAMANRELECQRWSSIEISDEATDARVSHALSLLKCDLLDAEVVVLRHKYAQSPPALRALDTAGSIAP
jgi:hypothetical protein